MLPSMMVTFDFAAKICCQLSSQRGTATSKKMQACGNRNPEVIKNTEFFNPSIFFLLRFNLVRVLSSSFSILLKS